jgi:hypothetical protein
LDDVIKRASKSNVSGTRHAAKSEINGFQSIENQLHLSLTDVLIELCIKKAASRQRLQR